MMDARVKMVIDLVLILAIAGQVSWSADVIASQGKGWNEYLDCSAIKIAPTVGCACINGLWRLFGDCSRSVTLAGDSYCVNTHRIIPSKQVHYALEVLPNQKSIAIVQSNSQVVKIPCHGKMIKHQVYRLSKDDLIVTGSPHTLKGSFSSACIFPRPGSYCFFNVTELIGPLISNVSMGCRKGLPLLPAAKCHAIKARQSCEDASEGFDISIKDEDDVVPSKDTNKVESSPLIRKKRSKGRKKPSRGFGRTFLGAPGQELDNKVDQIDTEDEDYIPTDELLNITSTNTDTVLSEIWNAIESQAEIVMGVRTPLNSDIDYGIPYFRILHASKRVMQKACPKAYVPPSFFDIATQVFIQVLMKRFAYEVPNANLPGFDRIMKALNNCVEEIPVFPFITPDSGGNASCNESAWGHGEFENYNASLELNISQSYVGLDRDPMIETAWKIFDAAVAYCYPYFQVSSFNDHHRFVAWILPLFNGDIMNVWTNGSATNFTYGKFMGNMETVMSRVAYCSAAARFTGHNITYPWEFTRPSNETGPPPPPAGRRKREVLLPLTECMTPDERSQCFSEEQLSFPNWRPSDGVIADNIVPEQSDSIS